MSKNAILPMLEMVMGTYRHQPGESTFAGACRSVVEASDFKSLARPPLSQLELDATVSAMLRYILEDPLNINYDIIFEVPRVTLGDSIELNEFAARYSQEFLFEALGFSKKALDLTSLDRLWASIVFRYRYCVVSHMDVFPISTLLQFCDTAQSWQGAEDPGTIILVQSLSALSAIEMP